MPTSLGAHNPKLAAVRELLAKKGRREHGRFAFEGPTLLDEALRANVAIDAVYATPGAYGRFEAARRAEDAGVPLYLVDERTLARISDLEAPPGIVSVAAQALRPAEELLREPGIVALFASISDPGNAGTLLRSAEAFGVDRVVFGTGGVEPYHPKVVRGAMGALFRVRLAVAAPDEFAAAAKGWEVTGLDAAGEPLDGMPWPLRSVVAIGSERAGLGPWQPLCTRIAAIPMRGNAESLNAAVAGSIALYEACKQAFS